MDTLSDDALVRLFEEGRRVLETQIQLGNGIDSKASEILRFNSILVGILVTGLSILLRSGPGFSDGLGSPTVGGFLFGFLLLVTSTLFCILAYQVPVIHLGLRAEDLRRGSTFEADERAMLEEMLDAYTRATDENSTGLDRSVRHLRWALWSLLAALAILAGTTTSLMLAQEGMSWLA